MINMLRTLGMLALLPTFLLPLTAYAELRIFACEPEWSALAEELGGDLVEASSATHALQDPHSVQARPSLISKVRNADLVICSGAQLEIGWLPMLLGKANNSQVLPGKDGFMEASSMVRRLDIPDSVDRAQGDMHPQGNPHIQMDPRNIGLVAQALGQRLALLDPQNAAEYRARTTAFLERWKGPDHSQAAGSCVITSPGFTSKTGWACRRSPRWSRFLASRRRRPIFPPCWLNWVPVAPART